MSYYMLGIEFWAEVSLFLGALPLLALGANRLASVLSRTSAPASSAARGRLSTKGGGLFDVCGAPSTR